MTDRAKQRPLDAPTEPAAAAPPPTTPEPQEEADRASSVRATGPPVDLEASRDALEARKLRWLRFRREWQTKRSEDRAASSSPAPAASESK